MKFKDTFSLVYDDYEHKRNLKQCDIMISQNRFVYDAWVHSNLIGSDPQVSTWPVDYRPKKYIYPIGLFNNPWDWSASPGPFGWLSPQVLGDARAGNVLFIMDQSQEGGSQIVSKWSSAYKTAPSLWEWFYDHCKYWSISSAQVVYLTSDHLAESRHAAYCDSNGIAVRMQVISSLYNLYILNASMRQILPIPEYESTLPKSKLFNCLNRMVHEHRKWFFCKMMQADLLNHGHVSMDKFTTMEPMPGTASETEIVLAKAQDLLPLIVDKADFTINYYNDLNPSIYQDSWFSVITETYVDDMQMLIGEKVFKPMMCFSPFMLLSTRGSLARLRDLGFKSFPMLWDESYDDMDDTGNRMDAIIDQMKMISRIDDLAAYFAQAESAVKHNHQMAWSLFQDSRDWQQLVAIWQDFVA
jgi:hypothetical protein